MLDVPVDLDLKEFISKENNSAVKKYKTDQITKHNIKQG